MHDNIGMRALIPVITPFELLALGPSIVSTPINDVLNFTIESTDVMMNFEKSPS